MPAPEPSTSAAYSVRSVAERLGVPTATLRSWNRRYGLGPPAHLAGRHRRYSAADLAVVERMVEMVRAGASPASAARAAREAGPAEIETDPDALVAAADRMEGAALVEQLDAHVAAHGVVHTWENLCRPAFAAIVARQAGGEQCIDVEHLLSWAVATSLRRVEELAVGDPASLILACVDGEWHTLALEALRAALAERGTDAQMLGPSVPADAVVAAIHRRRRRATVVLWSQAGGAECLATARAVVDAPATLLIGGPGWDTVTAPGGAVRVPGLQEAIAHLRG